MRTEDGKLCILDFGLMTGKCSSYIYRTISLHCPSLIDDSYPMIEITDDQKYGKNVTHISSINIFVILIMSLIAISPRTNQE
jgi:hypothetical protein